MFVAIENELSFSDSCFPEIVKLDPDLFSSCFVLHFLEESTFLEGLAEPFCATISLVRTPGKQ